MPKSGPKAKSVFLPGCAFRPGEKHAHMPVGSIPTATRKLETMGMLTPLKVYILDGAKSGMSTSRKVLFPMVRNDNNVHSQKCLFPMVQRKLRKWKTDEHK